MCIRDRYRLQIITKRSVFAGEMYLTIFVQWAMIILVLICRKSIHLTNARKKGFLLHFRSPWPWRLTYRSEFCYPIAIVVQRYVSTIICGLPISRKREARNGRTDRQADRRTGAIFNTASYREGCTINRNTDGVKITMNPRQSGRRILS